MSETMSQTGTPARKTYPAKKQKVPAFARFKGTSVWKQYRNKARAFAQFKDAERNAG